MFSAKILYLVYENPLCPSQHQVQHSLPWHHLGPIQQQDVLTYPLRKSQETNYQGLKVWRNSSNPNLAKPFHRQYLIILFTVCYTILMIFVQRIWYWINWWIPNWYFSLLLSLVVYLITCIDIVKRNSLLRVNPFTPISDQDRTSPY